MFAEKKASFSNRKKSELKVRNLPIFLLIICLTTCISCVSSTRGHYYYKTQDYEQAITEYNYVLKQNPNNFKANMGMGDIYFERKKFEKAKFYYDKAAQSHPDDSELKKKQAKLIKKFDSINKLKEEGNKFFSEKHYIEADAKYNEILNIYPDDKYASIKSEECKGIINKASNYFSRGANAERDGDYKIAFEKYKIAYELTPDNIIYRDKMDKIKIELDKTRAFISSQVETIEEGNYEEAIEILESKTRKSIKSDEMDYYLALSYSKAAKNQSNDNKTLIYMHKALKKIDNIRPDNEIFNKVKELKIILEEEIDRIENKVIVKMKKAQNYFEKKNFNQAMKMYNSIIKDYPDSKFIQECRKWEILCNIEEIMSMKYNPLPQLEQGDKDNVFEDVIIEISNETSFKIDFFYHGIDAGKVFIQPDSTHEISFAEGKYKMAARLFSNKLYLFARENELSKGKYTLLFYEQR